MTEWGSTRVYIVGYTKSYSSLTGIQMDLEQFEPFWRTETMLSLQETILSLAYQWQ